MRFMHLHSPSFSGFFASFWCRSNVGRCRSFANLSQKQKFFACSIFCTAVFSLVTVGDGHFHTFYIEKNFTFFLACVKTVYECHRLSLPSFSGFFALFLWRSVTVAFWNEAKPTKIKEKACGRWRLTYNNNCRCFCFVWEKLLSSRRWKRNDVGRCWSFPYLSM